MEVPCDICLDAKVKALKSCLVCLASYCETHLEPHHRVAALKRHKLINPIENLDDMLCKPHNKFFDLFCRTDQISICVKCTEHKTHDTVTAEEEYKYRKAQVGKERAVLQQMIEKRVQKVEEIKHSANLNKKDTEREIAEGIEAFTALINSIQRAQTELMEGVEERQRAAERQAEGFICKLEKEIIELQRRSTELERLSHCEVQIHLLQSPLPSSSSSSSSQIKNWSNITVHSHLYVGMVRKTVTRLEETFTREMEKLLKHMEKLYAIDVTLDPETAHPQLRLSKNGKQVKYGDTLQRLPNKSEWFDHNVSVLGKEGFSSGKFYFEIQVKGLEWDLGVVSESVKRKGENALSPKNGYWIIWLRDDNQYVALDDPRAPLNLEEKPEKIGVFVDYERGLVSFYDVGAWTLIYSFTGCNFTEKIYPFLIPSSYVWNDYPLIITTVKPTH
ncbi:E3 ubiquitin-protein ligase TRIM21-like [Lampris incognitus]|uniref:E3 ubiquitin-protein ligase TRIM21-like n=1 Tax=Lampris incognitus TaxID=2546036 RepID=UPI0024B5FEEF|nr:E3 ubiquitin-protein ligase TRIM21-like [Lampris incognitus]